MLHGTHGDGIWRRERGITMVPHGSHIHFYELCGFTAWNRLSTRLSWAYQDHWVRKIWWCQYLIGQFNPSTTKPEIYLWSSHLATLSATNFAFLLFISLRLGTARQMSLRATNSVHRNIIQATATPPSNSIRRFTSLRLPTARSMSFCITNPVHDYITTTRITAVRTIAYTYTRPPRTT